MDRLAATRTPGGVTLGRVSNTEDHPYELAYADDRFGIPAGNLVPPIRASELPRVRLEQRR